LKLRSDEAVLWGVARVEHEVFNQAAAGTPSDAGTVAALVMAVSGIVTEPRLSPGTAALKAALRAACGSGTGGDQACERGGDHGRDHDRRSHRNLQSDASMFYIC
jgi:hypothetical protein